MYIQIYILCISKEQNIPHKNFLILEIYVYIDTKCVWYND